MTRTDSEYILSLVREALGEFESRAVSAIARRTARVASLLGETELAVRLGLELKALGGHPPANAENTRRLMADPSTWGDVDGPAERALTVYMKNREIPSGEKKGLIAAHGLGEIEMWLEVEDDEFRDNEEWFTGSLHMRSIQDRVRHACFAALCSWEPQLSYTNTNEQIFTRFRAGVDSRLAAAAPDVLDQFSAVYRRLREAANNRESEASEELSQAVTTCRRILKAIADHLLPGLSGAATEHGHLLDDGAYRNRIFEYVKQKAGSDSMADMLNAELIGLIERFNATDKLASKGVHATIGLEEAELCAISTYVVAGELLALGSSA